MLHRSKTDRYISWQAMSLKSAYTPFDELEALGWVLVRCIRAADSFPFNKYYFSESDARADRELKADDQLELLCRVHDRSPVLKQLVDYFRIIREHQRDNDLAEPPYETLRQTLLKHIGMGAPGDPAALKAETVTNDEMLTAQSAANFTNALMSML